MNQIEMTAKLYESRRAARTLLGSHYKRDMDLWAIAIKGEAATKKVSELSAAIGMARESDDPFRSIVILAAAVEMMEPSAAQSGEK